MLIRWEEKKQLIYDSYKNITHVHSWFWLNTNPENEATEKRKKRSGIKKKKGGLRKENRNEIDED